MDPTNDMPDCTVWTNYYRCACGEEWDDQHDCCCNDHCPACNCENEPYISDDGSLAIETIESARVSIAARLEATINTIVDVSPVTAE